MKNKKQKIIWTVFALDFKNCCIFTVKIGYTENQIFHF